MLKNLMILSLALCLVTSCGDDDVECDAGFSGENCEIRQQDLFVGTWNGTDCEGDDITIVITAGSEPQDLLVGIPGFEITAVIDSDTRFTMPSQIFTEPFFGTEITVSGTGTLTAEDMMTFSADVISAFESSECTSLLMR